jgi:hypothetical protein
MTTNISNKRHFKGKNKISKKQSKIKKRKCKTKKNRQHKNHPKGGSKSLRKQQIRDAEILRERERKQLIVHQFRQTFANKKPNRHQ